MKEEQKHLDTLQDIKQIIGVQLQAAGYYPNLNLIELVELFAGLYGANIKPMEMLEKVNLQDKAMYYLEATFFRHFHKFLCYADRHSHSYLNFEEKF